MTLTEEMIATEPCRYGLVSFFTKDNVISRSLLEYGEWAQSEIDFLLRLLQPGDTVIDVGAFIGTHTLAFAQKVGPSGKVYAFEARGLFYEVLNKNIGQNNYRNIASFNLALSDRVDSVRVASADPSQATNLAGTSLLQPLSASGDSSCEVVNTVPLDQFLITNCSLIKIDAENMESRVLRGARNTIRAARPVLFAECNSLEYGWPVVEFAREEGYESFVMSVRAYNPANYRTTEDNIFGEARETSLVLISADRKSIIESSFDGVAPGSMFLTPVLSIDDLALALLKKPQYKYEVLAHTEAAQVLGTDFWANEAEVQVLRNTMEDQNRLLSERRITPKSVTELKIYPAGFEGHPESTSHSATVRFGEWVSVEQDLRDGAGTGELRIDPADCPCVIHVGTILVEGQLGETLWSTNGALGFSKLRVAGSAVVASTDLSYLILSYGEDPQILLPHTFPGDVPIKVRMSLKIETSAGAYAQGVQRLGEALRATIAEQKVLQLAKDAYNAEIKDLSHSLSATESQLKEMRAELIASQAERMLVVAEESRLAGEKIRLQHERDQADLVLSKLKEKIAALQAEFDKEHATRLGMEFSKSWRITSPMRNFMLRLRNLRHKSQS